MMVSKQSDKETNPHVNLEKEGIGKAEAISSLKKNNQPYSRMRGPKS